jgi:HAD superfamily hydrolase (TIGR01509 family)
MKPFRAILFDMDGVIVNSEPYHERAFRDIFEQMGYGGNHGMHFPDYYGRSDRALLVDFAAKHQPRETLEQIAGWKQRHFLDILKRDEPIFDELPELVEKLAAHYPLAVASGSGHAVINEVLAMKGLRRFFPVVVSSQDVPNGKPAPDVFLRAAELLKVEPERCCVIEDSVAGVTAARAAGMAVIGITNSVPRERLASASQVVATYREIEEWLCEP